MREEFLHFIWSFQLFEHQNLQTTQHQLVHIFNQGEWNKGSGPDFFNSKMKIDTLEWVGNVEIHLKSSDWYVHKHQDDKAYENVILHVVWEDDKPVVNHENKLIPTIILKDRVDILLLEKYQQFIQNKTPIVCQNIIKTIDIPLKKEAIKQALFERLRKKAFQIENLVEENQLDWQETAYQWLAKAFGFQDNGEAFLALAKVLPLKYLQKHRDSILQMEALIFGQAGFLEKKIEEDTYMKALKKEYDFLKKKYKLQSLDVVIWKTGKLRPANFPTIRIAQFVAFLYEYPFVLATFLESPTIVNFTRKFQVIQSPYWEWHYTFGKLTKKKVPTLGKTSIESIVINTAVPLLIAYGKQKEEKEYQEKALDWLKNIKAEKNSITKLMEECSFELKTAYDTQGVIELNKNYCQKKRCLECFIGKSFMKNNVEKHVHTS